MAQYRKAPFVPLETERLHLRPISLEDAPRVQELFDNLNVLRYMAIVIPWPYPADGAIQYLQSVQPALEGNEMYYWAILRKGSEKEGLIGAIALTPDSDVDHRGFWLGEPYWGHGYMREAVTVVNDFAFDVLGMSELLLNNAEPNLGSHRLKEFCGAEIVAVKDTEYIGGTFPGVSWRLTAEAWRQFKEVGLPS